jgi:menaquinone-dependent protoporphyrinogen oxidase
VDVTVAVASRHRATHEIADVIADELRAAGHGATVVDAEDAEVPLPGDAVVIGSAIYLGKWMKPARRLAASLIEEAGLRPVYAFTSGPLGDPPEPDPPPDAELLGDLAGLVVDHAVFGGRLDRGELSGRERLVAKAVKAPEGDFRDLGAVHDYGCRIADGLSRGDFGR